MTAFGKKTAQSVAQVAQPAARAAFGKRAAPQPQGRFSAAANVGAAGASQAELSAKAIAFIEAERKRQSQITGLPPKPVDSPSYALPSKSSGAGVGAGKPVWGRRIIATLIDSFVVGAPLGFMVGFFGAASGAASSEAVFASGFVMMLVFSMVLALAYAVVMESSEAQATLGKMAVGAIVTDKSGNKPTLGAVIMRNTIGKFVSGITPFYIGYLIGAARTDKRCLHDLIAGTMVSTKSPGAVSQVDAFA
jgi:uncharacterized RDD family membrane protein YckC